MRFKRSFYWEGIWIWILSQVGFGFVRMKLGFEMGLGIEVLVVGWNRWMGG